MRTSLSSNSTSGASSDHASRNARPATSHTSKHITNLEALPGNDNIITPHYTVSRLHHLTPPNTLFLPEADSSYPPVADLLRRNEPGTYFTSRATTALGWHGGAALGAKLANPSKTVRRYNWRWKFPVSFPSTVHWIARKCETPFLTVILNNRGWKSPMLSVMACHKDGYASQVSSDDLHVTFDPPPDHAQAALRQGQVWCDGDEGE